jgi:hypothetical protein
MAALKNLAVDCYSGFFSPCPPQKMTHLNAKNSYAESIAKELAWDIPVFLTPILPHFSIAHFQVTGKGIWVHE